MLPKSTQLTKDGIKNLIDKNYKGSLFQMIEMNNVPGRTNMATTTSEKPTEKFKVTISDGFAKIKTFFASEACKLITSGVAKDFSVFEIISAVVNNNISDKLMIIVVKISMVYEDINDIIGSPIEFDEYKKMNFQNPNGFSAIPVGIKQEKANEYISKDNFSSKNNFGKLASNQISNNKNEISNQPQAKSFSLINKFQQNTNFNGNARTNNNNNSFNNSIDEENHSLMTIAMLSPVCDSNWKIKARILKKNDIKQYKNAKGEGCLFSIEIMDKNQTEISCSFFNNGCDKWFDFLNEGNIYIFSGGYIKDNNSRYNTKNEYQISFDEKSLILAAKDDGSILRQKFFFVKLNQISDYPLGNQIDVIVVIKDPGENAQITLKSGEIKSKRNLHVFDESMTAIEITLWGEIATRDFFADTIAIFKQVRISEFNSTRNLSSGFSTQIILDCEDIPEFQNLLLWQKQGGKDVNISIPIKGPSVLKFKTLAKLEEEASEKLVDVNDKLFSDVKAYLAFIRNNENATLYYLSCPTEKCLRKVLEESDGWRCEKCNKSFPEPLARFIISAKIADDTASLWVSVYDPTATLLIGKTANDIKMLKEQGQSEIVNNFFKNAQYVQLRMKILSKMEIYNGETKIKHQILKIVPKEINKENQNMLSQIDSFFKK